MRRYYYKRNSLETIILILIVCLGLGYAYINSDLNINGTAQINSANWDVHWANVQVQDGSVTGSNVVTTPAISGGTTVNYSVILNIPGDYYEFTVDAVNGGAIDAMIDTIESKLNGATITNLPAYLGYTVTYADDIELEPNHELLAGATETYKVRIEYKTDIDLEQIPATNQTLSLSFTVTYRQSTDAANAPKRLYGVLKTAAAEGTYAKQYTGDHRDSITKSPSKNIYYWYGSDDTNAAAILDMNNVIFGGFCWQMIRTTDTGGVKLVYNGVPAGGRCNSSGTDQQIAISEFNPTVYSIAYAGYMYNPDTLITKKANSAATSGSLFGTGVTYSGGTYTLTSTSTTYDTTHHYTCNNTTGTCSTVRYYYYDNYYSEISDGRNIEQCLEDMLSADNVNQTNSTIKTAVDNWYASNMTSYTSKLEDVIFCNDRSISNLGGFNPNGGGKTSHLYFKSFSVNNDLSCTNITDKFSMANSKAKLTYPVGLLTSSELNLLNNTNISKTTEDYWTLSPNGYTSAANISATYIRYVTSAGNITGTPTYSDKGVRPAISLKPGTKYTSGDGSKNNPYIVE